MTDEPQLPASPSAARPAGRARRGAGTVGLVVLGAVVLGGCKLPTFGTFTPWTSEAHDAYKLYQWLNIVAMVIGAFVWGLIFWCVIRYRRRPTDTELPKQTRYNIPWEIAYTITPILIVAGIFGYTIVAEDAVDQVVKRPAVTIDVTGFQWGWKFAYANTPVTIQPTAVSATRPVGPSVASEGGNGQVVSYPTMVLPEHRTVQINLVSQDVVHGFYVPEFEFSRYAQPGVTNVFDFTPNRTGTFKAQCTQFCGLYHAQMIFYVKVVSASAYQSWLHSQETKAVA